MTNEEILSNYSEYADISIDKAILAMQEAREEERANIIKNIEISLSAESKLGASDEVIKSLLSVKYFVESLSKQEGGKE